MTWIKTLGNEEADDKLKELLARQRSLYPIEYATPVDPTRHSRDTIVASHSLMPEAMFHAFSAFGAMMAPDLPLQRRHHEMIATVVSATNRCQY